MYRHGSAFYRPLNTDVMMTAVCMRKNNDTGGAGLRIAFGDISFCRVLWELILCRRNHNRIRKHK